MHVSSRAVLLFGAVLLAGGRIAKAEGPPEAPSAEGTPSPEKRRPPHPEPRVIVNVASVRGPHRPAEVQRSARSGWSRIVRCYKASGPPAPVVVTLELLVSGNGNVANARQVRTKPKHRELATCLAGALRGLAMPKAPESSTASVEIQLAPGDPPSKS